MQLIRCGANKNVYFQIETPHIKQQRNTCEFYDFLIGSHSCSMYLYLMRYILGAFVLFVIKILFIFM